MEVITNVWVQYIAPIFGGLSITAILTAVIYAIIKGSVSKLINKVNIEKLQEKAVNSGVDKIKEMTFKHDITPIVIEQMKVLNEQALKEFKELIVEHNKQYENIVGLLKEFSAYFDDSIAISADKKAQMKAKLEEAEKSIPQKIEPVESVVVIDEPVAKESKKSIKR